MYICIYIPLYPPLLQDLACLPDLAAPGAGHAGGGRALPRQLLSAQCVADRDRLCGSKQQPD